MDKEFIENPVEAYEKLKQECEELTSKCSQLKENFKETADGLLKIQYALADHCNKYSKTLAEIKEIAYDGYNNGQTSYATFQCEKIINKINEVENV